MYKTQSSDLIYDNYSLNVLSCTTSKCLLSSSYPQRPVLKAMANNKSHLNEWWDDYFFFLLPKECPTGKLRSSLTGTLPGAGIWLYPGHLDLRWNFLGCRLMEKVFFPNKNRHMEGHMPFLLTRRCWVYNICCPDLWQPSCKQKGTWLQGYVTIPRRWRETALSSRVPDDLVELLLARWLPQIWAAYVVDPATSG